MSAVNNVTLVGNVGNNPAEDLKEFGEAKKVELRLAIRRTYKNKDGEYDTDWVSIHFWNRRAENVAEYATQGSLVSVSGEVRTDKYEDSNGNTRNAFFIEGDQFQVLKRKQEGEGAPF